MLACFVVLDGPPGHAIQLAALVTDDSLIKVVSLPAEDVDEVAVLAYVRPLITAARDMRAWRGVSVCNACCAQPLLTGLLCSVDAWRRANVLERVQ